MKNYTIKPNKKQLKVIKLFWDKFQELESEYYGKLFKLEKELEKETKIDGIEFFSCDGEYVGVGNDARTMKLIHLR